MIVTRSKDAGDYVTSRVIPFEDASSSAYDMVGAGVIEIVRNMDTPIRFNMQLNYLSIDDALELQKALTVAIGLAMAAQS